MGICESYFTRNAHKLLQFRPFGPRREVFDSNSVISSHRRWFGLSNSGSVPSCHSVSPDAISNIFRSLYKYTLTHKLFAVEFLYSFVGVSVILEHGISISFLKIDIANFTEGLQQRFQILFSSIGRQSSTIDPTAHTFCIKLLFRQKSFSQKVRNHAPNPPPSPARNSSAHDCLERPLDVERLPSARVYYVFDAPCLQSEDLHHHVLAGV